MRRTVDTIVKSLLGTIIFGAILAGTAYAAGAFDANDDDNAICCNDGVDNDCDGLVDCDDSDCANVTICRCIDSDGDGYYANSDCGTELDPNDNNASITPGVGEVHDDEIDSGIDDEIDSGIDDDICVECEVCNELKQACFDTCSEITSNASDALCDKFPGPGCAHDYTKCGERACSYAYEQYYCKKPGYLECIKPKMEEYLSGIASCNQEYVAGRTSSNWREMWALRSQCKDQCEELWTLALYEECRPEACDAYCKEQGYTGGSWERVRDGGWDKCWCNE